MSWKAAVDAFYRTEPSPAAVTLLKKIVANIVANPKEEKYRRLQLEKVEQKLEGGVNVLQALGFVPSTDDKYVQRTVN